MSQINSELETDVTTETRTNELNTDRKCWSKYSENRLASVEKKILQYVEAPYHGRFVDIGPVIGKSDKIWTISLNTNSSNTPLVLLHGFGAGVALWCLNLDSLSAKRPVFAIDLLGFGRSSRPSFSNNGAEAEQQMIKAIEEWRKVMNLERFILLGHSMGGFLATSYSILYPQRVEHLLLADPWGFPEKPANQSTQRPLWVRVLGFTLQPFNPLWAVRVAGPFGQWVVNKVRADIARKFETYLTDSTLITEYIYQCNSQKPSGESAFHSMLHGMGWAKHPMEKRIHTLHEDVPITVMCGSESWISSKPAEIIKENRTKESFVQIHIIMGAGHHVYSDKPEAFNKHVVDTCELADASSPGHVKLIPAEKIDDELDLQANKSTPLETTATPIPNTTPAITTITT